MHKLGKSIILAGLLAVVMAAAGVFFLTSSKAGDEDQKQEGKGTINSTLGF
jgi:hypothetical protein